MMIDEIRSAELASPRSRNSLFASGMYVPNTFHQKVAEITGVLEVPSVLFNPAAPSL